MNNRQIKEIYNRHWPGDEKESESWWRSLCADVREARKAKTLNEAAEIFYNREWRDPAAIARVFWNAAEIHEKIIDGFKVRFSRERDRYSAAFSPFKDVPSNGEVKILFSKLINPEGTGVCWSKEPRVIIAGFGHDPDGKSDLKKNFARFSKAVTVARAQVDRMRKELKG